MCLCPVASVPNILLTTTSTCTPRLPVPPPCPLSYTLVRETKKPSFVRLDRRTNEEVKTQTKYLCEVRSCDSHMSPAHSTFSPSQDTGSELMPSDIKYYQNFGGEKVGVAVGMGVSVVMGVVLNMMGVALSVVIGVAPSMMGMALRVVMGVALSAVMGMVLRVVMGVALNVVMGVAPSVVMGVALTVTMGVALRAVMGVALSGIMDPAITHSLILPC